MNPIYKFELNRESANLVDPDAIVENRVLDPGNGSLTVDNSYNTSGYMAVVPGQTYAFKDASNNAITVPVIVLYEQDKSFNSGQSNVSQITIPSDNYYIRFSLSNSIDVRQISFGLLSQPFIPYFGPRSFPIWNNDLGIDFEKESNEEFFRAKLSGKIVFVGPDYDWIVARAFDYQFVLTVFISYDAGATWAEYWRGTFWKTDCEFDDDTKAVSVKPTVLDRYNDVLAGMDKEYNLIELAPEIKPVLADKRPMIQVYVPGQTVIGCFLSGMWWEQECEAVEESDNVEIEGHTYPALTHKYHFALNKTRRIIEVDQSDGATPVIPNVFSGAKPSTEIYGYQFTNGDYTARYVVTINPYFEIVQNSTNTVMWRKVTTSGIPPVEITLDPVAGSGATGTVTVYVHDVPVYARYICDTEQVAWVNTYPLPADDLVENNRNYNRVIGYNFPDTIYFSTEFSETPTQWGLYKPGQYYQTPYLIYDPEFFPIARNGWGRYSIWFTSYLFDWIVEESARKQFTIRHAYPLASVLSVLLNKVAPGITHEATTAYSQFLYGTNIIGINQTLLITPKSNIVSSGYDEPAQTAPITLKNVLNMLRDCFRCYWFIDDQNRFRVEHIQFFRNGGSYTGTPVVGIDLTTQQVTRNGKPWAYAQGKYQFDKPEMAARYQFGWMDDVTQLFDGYPIDIISKYVNPDNIEKIEIARFTSDIDYILLNPGDVSKDGFVLLSAILSGGGLVLPYYNFVIGVNNHYLQNAYVAFCILQGYYAYDMPARFYEINGEQMEAYGVKRLRTQTVKFPLLYDPDFLKLVKTNLGNGMIKKLSVNLSSRNANATLNYDTE